MDYSLIQKICGNGGVVIVVPRQSSSRTKREEGEEKRERIEEGREKWERRGDKREMVRKTLMERGW